MASTATTIIARGYLTIAEVHDGDPARTYVLLPSVESVTKKLDGTLSATEVSCSVYKVTGASAYELSGDHTLTYTRRPDGATGTLGHASGTSTPVPVIAATGTSTPVLAATEAIEFELSDGTNVIDRVRVPVLSDATDVNNELDRYKYLRAALEQDTTIRGGLILSSLIALGYTDRAGVRHTMAGTNGVWQSDLEGRTIGSWWGGPMKDLFDKNDKKQVLAPGAYATSLIRMDGTGYFVDGLFRIKKTGLEIGDTANGYGISMGMDGRLIMGNGININIGGSAQGLAASIESVTNLANKLSNLFTPYLGDTPKTWAEVSIPGTHFDSVKVNVGLWTDSFLSCRGKNDSASAGGGGAFGLMRSWPAADPGESTNDALGANLGFYLYKNKADVSALTALTSRVSVLESKNYLDALVLSVVGSGNAVTAITLSADKKTLTVTKGSPFLTQHQSLENYLRFSDATDYVAARFAGSTTLAQRAVATYIEFWQGGWFNFKAGKYIVSGGTSSQFLKADGSLDGNSYALASSLANYYTKTESNRLFAPVAAYDLRDGCLVKLNVSDKSAAMVTVLIEGNSYQYDLVPVKTILNFYNYPTDNTILNAKAIHFGYDFGNIKVFTYGGNICLWFKQGRTFQSFFVSAFHQNYKGNIVESVTNSAMPTVGVARLVEITPSKGLRTDNYASVLSSVYAPLSHTHTFASLTSKPTTIAGYGITDAYTKGETDGKYVKLTADETIRGLKIFARTIEISTTTDTKLILNNTDDEENYTYISFRQKGTEVGKLGFTGISQDLRWNSNKILHEGNYSSILDSRYYTETEINAKLTNGSVTKVGTATVGSSIKPIYLNKGIPTECITSFGNNSGQIAWSNGTLCTNLNADMLDGKHNGEVSAADARYLKISEWILPTDYPTVKSGKDRLAELVTAQGYGIGHPINIGADFINKWDNEDASVVNSNTYAFTKIGGAYSGDTYGQWLLSTYGNERLAVVGRINKVWTSIHYLAFTTDNVASATKLADNTAFKAWGQTFFENGKPKAVVGDLALVPQTADVNADSMKLRFCGGLTSNGPYIKGVNVNGYGRKRLGFFQHNATNYTTEPTEVFSILPNGSVGIGTTAPAYKLDVNGTARVSSLKIGEVTISYDAANGGLHVSGGGLYSDSYISAKGSNSDTGGGGGGAFGLMRSWPAADPGESTNDALGANLGFYLYKNKADASALTALTSRVTTLEGKEYVTSLGISGNYLTWTKNGAVNNITVPYAEESSLFSPISKGVVFDANTVGSTQRISYYNTIHSGTTNIPYNSGWQSALLDIGLHPNGASAQLYFTLNHSMYFRPNKTESWRTILDSANTQISDGTISINGTSITPLTQHQNIYSLTIQRNGVTVDTFDPNGADKTINLSDIASAATLSAHTSNSTIHITASERTAWNNKVDKVSGKGLSANDFTDALLSKLNGIAAGANKYVLPTAGASVLGGVKIGDNITISNGVISTHAPYVHPTATATTIAAASGKVLSAITVNGLGHVTSVSSKTLAAADIPALPWSKITSGKPTTLAGYGITDAVGLYAEQDIAGWKTFLGGFNVTDKSTMHNFADLPRITMSVQGWCYSKFVHSTDDKIHLLDGAATSFEGMHKTFVAGSFVKYGGTANQFLKADGSVGDLNVFKAGNILANRISFNNGQNFMEWDYVNNAFKVNGDLYATGGLSCLGFSHISATEVAVTSIKVGDAVFTQSGGEIYVTIGSTRYKLTKTTA